MNYPARAGHGYGDNSRTRRRNNLARARKKTEWQVDLWRKDPRIIKTEDLAVSPCPNEITETNAPTVDVKLGNQTINAGVTVGIENERKIQFSKIDKVQAKNNQ